MGRHLNIGKADAILVIKTMLNCRFRKREDIAFHEDQLRSRQARMFGKDKVFARNMKLKLSVIKEKQLTVEIQVTSL